MRYDARVRATTNGEEFRFYGVNHVSFITPDTHGDPVTLLERSPDGNSLSDSDDTLFINSAAVLSVRLKESSP